MSLRPCIGIDPGRTSGIALVDAQGSVVYSTSVRVWRGDGLAQVVCEIVDSLGLAPRPIVALERQGGLGAAAIAESAGAVRYALFISGLWNPKRVVRPQASAWRRGAPSGKARPKGRDAWKAWAQAECVTMGLSPSSDDEAEAILIALYGWATQEGGICNV